MTWTDERVDFLKQRWAEGVSASIIAEELGGVSRCGVVGKVFRLGLEKRRTRTMRNGSATVSVDGHEHSPRKQRNYSVLQKFCGAPERIKQREAEAEIRAEFYATEVADLTPEQKATAVTFLQLEKHHCKWGYGDPRRPDFVFCGCDRMPDSPYCAPHAHIATHGAAA